MISSKSFFAFSMSSSENTWVMPYSRLMASGRIDLSFIAKNNRVTSRRGFMSKKFAAQMRWKKVRLSIVWQKDLSHSCNSNFFWFSGSFGPGSKRCFFANSMTCSQYDREETYLLKDRPFHFNWNRLTWNRFFISQIFQHCSNASHERYNLPGNHDWFSWARPEGQLCHWANHKNHVKGMNRALRAMNPAQNHYASAGIVLAYKFQNSPSVLLIKEKRRGE